MSELTDAELSEFAGQVPMNLHRRAASIIIELRDRRAELLAARAVIADLTVADRLHEANGTCPRCGANNGELDRLDQRATAAEARIEAVRALHRHCGDCSVDWLPMAHDHCTECEWGPWPCPTIDALSGATEPAAGAET